MDENEVKNNGRIYLSGKKEVEKFIEDNESIILFLYMPNSSSSRFQEEVLESLHESYQDKVSFASIDVLKYQDFAISKGIRKFPTTLYIKGKEIVNSISGVDKSSENTIMQIL